MQGQQANLDNLRARVGILLSAATIATSFLGGLALDGGRTLLLFGYVAIGLFVTHIALGLYILWPRGWKFQTSAELMVKNWIERHDVDEDQLRRVLAVRADRHHSRQGAHLDWLWNAYAAAIVVLAAEIGAWLAELGGTQDWLCQTVGVVCR